MVILLFVLSACGMITTELSSKLAPLKEVKIHVEIFSINKDIVKSSYMWHEPQALTFEHKGAVIEYSFLDSTYMSNSSYWALWDFSQTPYNFKLLPVSPWWSFSIILIHSADYALLNPSYYTDDTFCACSALNYSVHNEKMIFYVNPSENVETNLLHKFFMLEYFLVRLGEHKIFELIKEYREIVENIEFTLEPLIVMWI